MMDACTCAIMHVCPVSYISCFIPKVLHRPITLHHDYALQHSTCNIPSSAITSWGQSPQELPFSPLTMQVGVGYRCGIYISTREKIIRESAQSPIYARCLECCPLHHSSPPRPELNSQHPFDPSGMNSHRGQHHQQAHASS